VAASSSRPLTYSRKDLRAPRAWTRCRQMPVPRTGSSPRSRPVERVLAQPHCLVVGLGHLDSSREADLAQLHRPVYPPRGAARNGGPWPPRPAARRGGCRCVRVTGSAIAAETQADSRGRIVLARFETCTLPDHSRKRSRNRRRATVLRRPGGVLHGLAEGHLDASGSSSAIRAPIVVAQAQATFSPRARAPPRHCTPSRHWLSAGDPSAGAPLSGWCYGRRRLPTVVGAASVLHDARRQSPRDLAASVRVTSHHLHGAGIRRVTSALTRGTG
jgi:hypothetical protein